MDRREFIIAGTVAAVAASIPKLHSQEHTMKPVFKLKYAPHFGMFENSAGKDLLDQLQFAADEGFRAWEDNGMMGRDKGLQQKIADKMASLSMEMGVFCSYIGFGKKDMVSRTDKDFQDELRDISHKSVETAKRVNAKWCTVVPGEVEMKLDYDYQMANCVENLRVMAEIFEKTGLVMVLEPLNWQANHPGLFLTKMAQAYNICTAVNSPSCKILDDLYHQQITEGNLIPNIDKCWKHIAYFQTGDNPGRKEPTTGEINYRNVFAHIHSKGYTGIVGMEHGNSQKGKDGERAVIEAYRKCDDF
jgi:hydroxypyruvate isomerase